MIDSSHKPFLSLMSNVTDLDLVILQANLAFLWCRFMTPGRKRTIQHSGAMKTTYRYSFLKPSCLIGDVSLSFYFWSNHILLEVAT